MCIDCQLDFIIAQHPRYEQEPEAEKERDGEPLDGCLCNENKCHIIWYVINVFAFIFIFGFIYLRCFRSFMCSHTVDVIDLLCAALLCCAFTLTKPYITIYLSFEIDSLVMIVEHSFPTSPPCKKWETQSEQQKKMFLSFVTSLCCHFAIRKFIDTKIA